MPQLSRPAHRDLVSAEQFQRDKLGRFLGHVSLIELGNRDKIGGQFEVHGSHAFKLAEITRFVICETTTTLGKSPAGEPDAQPN
jgi:hypothetical protein